MNREDLTPELIEKVRKRADVPRVRSTEVKRILDALIDVMVAEAMDK